MFNYLLASVAVRGKILCVINGLTEISHELCAVSTSKSTQEMPVSLIYHSSR